MIKRPTIILLILLVVVVGAFLITKYHPLQSTQGTPTSTGTQFLITSSDGTLIKMTIQDNSGKVVEMQRDPSQSWIVVVPAFGMADQGLAGAAETQVGAIRVVTELPSPPVMREMGLDVPSLTISLDFDGGIHHRIEVGNLTPTSNGYYVHFDEKKVVVVSQSGIDSLRNLLTHPPYQPIASPTSTSTVEISITPQVTQTTSATP
jgi:hypothetical protein